MFSRDVFAVGVMPYKLLCRGQHPYEGGRPMVGEKVGDPRSSRPDLDIALAEFLVKSCAPYRDGWFRTALEMKEALESAVVASAGRLQVARTGQLPGI